MQPVQAGRELFLGQVPFQNGGPPCAACHRIAALGFPNGGLVGPDLSGVSQTLGPDGVDVTLKTLFFPTMMPLYSQRPLIASEQQALKGFLLQSQGPPAGQTDTLVLGVLALGGLIVLLAATWVTGRRRLRGVRAPLVRAARREGVHP